MILKDKSSGSTVIQKKKSCTESDYKNVISKTTLTMKNVWQDAQYDHACQVSGVLLLNIVQLTKN